MPVVRLVRVAVLVLTASLCLLAGTTGRAQTPASPTAPLKLTWQQALDRALARNPSVVVAAQEVERASALIRQARAGWLPTLSGNGSYVHASPPRPPSVAGIPRDTWNGNLALQVPLVAPTGWMNEAHARDNRDVAQQGAADVRRQLAVAVGRATTMRTPASPPAWATAWTRRAPSRSCAATRRR